MIPSIQESIDALVRAKQALEDYRGKFWFGNLTKVEREFVELDLLDESERFMAIDIALQEIEPGHRSGPPEQSNVSDHPPFAGLRLYAFCWESAERKKRMYMKFALSPDCKQDRLVIYSFHESKPY
jgi:hypothetical protein